MHLQPILALILLEIVTEKLWCLSFHEAMKRWVVLFRDDQKQLHFLLKILLSSNFQLKSIFYTYLQKDAC